MVKKSGVKVTSLTHDFSVKKSFVRIVWEDDPAKALGLEVPFGCGLERVVVEAEKAVRALSSEIAEIPVS
jgi:hypothetical protein